MNRSLFTREYVYSVLNLLVLHIGPYLLLSVISVYAMSLTGSNALAGAMTSVFPLTGLVGRFLAAGLLNRMSAKRVTIASTLLLTVASAAYLACGSYAMAFVLRGVQGLGYSMAVTSLSTHIVDILSPETRLEGIGYSSLTNTLCSVFGPTLAFAILGPDVDRFFLLFACVLVAACAALVMAVFSKEKAPVAAVAARQTEAGKGTHGLSWRLALAPVALLALVTFSQSSSSSFLTLYALAEGFEGIGLYFTLNAVGVFVSRFVMGRIVDRIGERATVVASIACMGAATAGIAWADSIVLLYLVAVPFGFAVGMLQPVVNTRVVEVMGEGKSGLANALFYAAGDVGFITGPTLWGALAGVSSYETMFLTSAAVLGVCAVVGLFCGFKGGRSYSSKTMAA